MSKDSYSPPPDEPTRQQTTPSPQWAHFYHEFELRFRGSVELIAARLEERYRERLAALKRDLDPSSPPVAIDLGCGRGEFLDLTHKVGFTTWGCDESLVAVDSCGGRGHKVVTSDILNYVRSLPTGCASLVSLLHVIEHCPSPYMFEVFSEVARVVGKGGVFIVETPSLASLWASSRQFYLDPTHEKPVHPDYINFMAEYVGFPRREFLFFDEVVHPARPNLQELETELGPRAFAALRQWDAWLFGAMDVAIWAQKQ